MKKTFCVAAVLLAGVSQLVIAQGSNPLVSYYDSELFQFSYNMFGGLTLNYRNQASSTQFGIPQNMKTVLHTYPDSKAYIESYSKLNLAGNILLWGGLAAALVGAYYPLFAMDLDGTTEDWDTQYKISLGFAVGGLVSSLVGAFLYPASFEKLCQGVNAYNRHKITEYP